MPAAIPSAALERGFLAMLQLRRRPLHLASLRGSREMPADGLGALLGAHFLHACARGVVVFLVPWVVLAAGASVPEVMAAGALRTAPPGASRATRPTACPGDRR